MNLPVQLMGEELLHKLEQSVTAVQQKYGCHSGLAIEEDYCVSTMCRNLENVLLHHAKFRRATFLKDTDDDVLVWDLVSRFLAKSEIVRFENEVNLKSGIGRLRSWIRSALNDGLVEKYLQLIADSDTSLLRLYYEEGSVMLDKEIVATLPGILSGVSTVLFSFDLDRSSFNTPVRVDRTMSARIAPETVSKPPCTGGSSVKGKRKVKRAEIVDTDAPQIVETTAVENNPDIEKMLEGSSLFGGEDVDLKNLLVGLIPQPPPSASGSSDEDIGMKEKLGYNSSSPHNSSPRVDQMHSPLVEVPIMNEDLDLSFEVGALPDTPTYGGPKSLIDYEASNKAEIDSTNNTDLLNTNTTQPSPPVSPPNLQSTTVSHSVDSTTGQPESQSRDVMIDSKFESRDITMDSETVDSSLQPGVSHLPTPYVSTPPISTSPVSSVLCPTGSQTIGAVLRDTALDETVLDDTVLDEDEVVNSDGGLKESGFLSEKQVDEGTEQQDLEIKQDTIIDTVKKSETEPEVVIEKNAEDEKIDSDLEYAKEGEEDEEDTSFDPYDSEDLPRSSNVICKPYSPPVKRILSSKGNRSDESERKTSTSSTDRKKGDTLTKDAEPICVSSQAEPDNTSPNLLLSEIHSAESPSTCSVSPELKTPVTLSSPTESPQPVYTNRVADVSQPSVTEVQLPTDVQPRVGTQVQPRAGTEVPRRRGSNQHVISCSAPTSVLPPSMQRTMSIQLPQRLPPLGSPVRTEFDIDEFSNNSDAVSICSDISSVRDYAASNRSTGDGMDNETGSISTISSSVGIAYTTGELRNVLSSLLQQKEDIESQNRQLQETLSREMMTRASLKDEIEHMQNTFIQRQGHDQAVIRGLQRENQMLKQQLKKYVTVVQQLRRDDCIPSDTELSSVLVEVPVLQPLQIPAAQANVPFNNSAVEQKLAQVSEMHGELMELNQQLVAKNMIRERQLQDMEKKLAEIEAKEASRTQRKTKRGITAKPDVDFSDFQLVDSPLLQIWIPAAMIRGEGVKKHHVYQIIVQVGGEQWTVYRRYAEFRSFHKVLIGKQPYFSKLELPGKTHFNRKVPSVVEERRAKLEIYLQRVTSCLADRRQGVDSTNMDLHASPCKASVTSAIHFLREEETQENLHLGF